MKINFIDDKNRINGLDHLRAFAICYVVLFHYRFFKHPIWVDNIGGFGWSGVDLFFALSGYLIAGELFKFIISGQPIALKIFFTKRFFRIVPPYLIILCLYHFFPSVREREHIAPMWRYLTFTINFGLDVTKTGTFTHSWSLCVEEQFYLFFPLIIILLKYIRFFDKGFFILIGLSALGIILRLTIWQKYLASNLDDEHFGALYNEYIYYPTYNRLDSLIAGVGIAALNSFYPRFKHFSYNFSNHLMLTGSILLVVAYFACTPQQTNQTAIWGYPLIAIAYGLIIAGIVSPSNLLYNFKSWITYQIATLSYAIYLVHKMVIHATQTILIKAGVDADSTIMMMYSLTITLLIAIIIRYLIEKPAMLIRDKLLPS